MLMCTSVVNIVINGVNNNRGICYVCKNSFMCSQLLHSLCVCVCVPFLNRKVFVAARLASVLTHCNICTEIHCMC